MVLLNIKTKRKINMNVTMGVVCVRGGVGAQKEESFKEKHNRK